MRAKPRPKALGGKSVAAQHMRTWGGLALERKTTMIAGGRFVWV